MNRPLAAAALTVLAAAVGYGNYRYRHRRRQQEACPPAAPKEIQTWESEGGGVPVGDHTAAQVSPDPALSSNDPGGAPGSESGSARGGPA